MIEVIENKDIFWKGFERFQKKMGTQQPGWLEKLRQKAFSVYEDRGLPTVNEEEWRFTNPAPLTKGRFEWEEKPDDLILPGGIPAEVQGEWAGWRLVFINGRFSSRHSLLRDLPGKVFLGSLATALKSHPRLLEEHLGSYAAIEENVFAALNTAFIEDGAFIHIPRGVTLDGPVHLLFVATPDSGPRVSQPRNLVVMEDSSHLQLVETYWGGHSGYFTNGVTEIVLGDNSNCEHYKFQQEDPGAFHLATLQFHLGRDAHLTSHSISLGGALSRNDLNVALDGEGAEAVLNGFYFVDGKRLTDNHTRIYHNQPHCSSHELYKGILDEQGRGVFNGRIYVHPGAQKTDSKQTNKNLILSEEALVNTNPQLEIYADDVKCTHGATIGRLDTDALFYLQSRGIGLKQARELLTYAFANDVTGRLRIPALRESLEKRLFRQFASSSEIQEES
jgi:Fe-S cluster assembly protein SufD